MDNKIVVSKDKILEHNEKAFKDTEQLLSRIESFEEFCGRYHPDMDKMLPSMFIDKGRTIWVELKVEDSFLSGLMYTWMFSSSNYDKSSGLHALGCSIQTIMYAKPSGYTEEEKHCIKSLYEKAFGTV